MSSSEYLNYESGKFSKSLGVGVFGTDIMASGIGADVWRFYVFYNRPEKADALFTWKDFQEKVNGELIGNLGNLVNRTLSFVGRYYDGVIPAGAPDPELWSEIKRREAEIGDKLDRAELRDAFRTIFELSSLANKAFQDGEPWKYRTENPAKAAALIRDLCYVVRDLAVLVHPYIPSAADRIAAFFGGKIGAGAFTWESLGNPVGLDRVGGAEVLFNKLEDELVDALRVRYSGTQKERLQRDEQAQAQTETVVAPPPVVPDQERFAAQIDLRVAEIVKIERHPKADKLYVETLEIAGEERTIVSGLVPYYREEELLGKRIILAYNLKAAKLRGIESKGMLLAAADETAEGVKRVEVLDAGRTATGTRVTLEGAAPTPVPAEIDIDAFFSVPIVTRDGVVGVAGHALTLEAQPLKTTTVLNGEVG